MFSTGLSTESVTEDFGMDLRVNLAALSVVYQTYLVRTLPEQIIV
jgi:hypothetical protein